MSAIFGILRFDGAPVAREHLLAMSGALARHGEDVGFHLEGALGLGCRPMQFTPEDRRDRQPVGSADGSRILVADARLDNRDELLAELKAVSRLRPPPGPDDPDSDLLLRAFEAWGRDCTGHLAGVFAVAVWDSSSRTLSLVRSAIVAPSLVYLATDRLVAFATMPSGLHALPFVRRALDEERLSDLIARTGSGDTEATLYQGIRRLRTGHWMVAGPGGVKTECHWPLDRGREERFARDEDYLGAFDGLFGRVVASQLRGFTPVAMMLSGGLDSSSVAAKAAGLLARRGERLAAFTEVPRGGFEEPLPPGRYADETPLVSAIAGMHPEIDLELVRTDGQTFLYGIGGLFAHLEAPFRNTSNRVWIEEILRRTRARGIRVLLDGAQGNLTMSWNGSGLLSALVRRGRWSEAVRQARAGVRSASAGSIVRTLVGQGFVPLLPDPLWLALDALRHPGVDRSAMWLRGSAINPQFAEERRVTERARERSFAVRFRPRADTRRIRYEALANQDFGGYVSSYRAMYGVDMRSPSADRRLADFCLALPEEQYQRDGESRRLIRRGMSGCLPAEVLANRMRGMQSADWFERLAGARPLIAAELEKIERSSLARRMLDTERLRRLFERMPSAGGGEPGGSQEYSHAFQDGLMVGRFLSWFETGG